MNALVRHPVLRNDPLIVSFLTEPIVCSYFVTLFEAHNEEEEKQGLTRTA